MLKSYKELIVWQKAYQLCLKVYNATQNFPHEERYGLTQQIRKSVVSVSSNIAEGYGRGAIKEYIHHLHIAYGSNCELETQLMLASDLGYVSKNHNEFLMKDIEEVERMLKSLIKSLKAKIP